MKAAALIARAYALQGATVRACDDRNPAAVAVCEQLEHLCAEHGVPSSAIAKLRGARLALEAAFERQRCCRMHTLCDRLEATAKQARSASKKRRVELLAEIEVTIAAALRSGGIKAAEEAMLRHDLASIAAGKRPQSNR